MTRVLIIQECLPHYRVPLFDRLASRDDIDLTICHSGPPTSRGETAYREWIAPSLALGPLRYQPGLLRSAGRFDVVVAAFDVRWLSTLGALLLNRKAGFVFWGLGMGRSPLANRLRLLALKKADALLLYSAVSRVPFERSGYPAERIFVAPNTIHVPNAGRNEHSRRDRFVFVGSLKPRKGVQDLLLAFERIGAGLPVGTGITIVGSGQERGPIEALCRRLGIEERVEFLGTLTSSEDLKKIFDRALAYVSPGQVGLGVLHSFAYGVPVITRRNAPHGPEVHNIMDGVNGYLYDGTIDSLARRLRGLATEPDVAERLGAVAYQHYSEKRTMNHMVQGFLETIRFAADARGNHRLPGHDR